MSPLATSMAMGYTGYMLFHRNEEKIKSIIDSRDIYVVPVVCPDYFPHSRAYAGIDPNRNFDKTKSVEPIEALKKLGLTLKPDAVLSLHTYGRVYLIPWGRSTSLCKDENKYKSVVGEMAKLSKYRMEHGCEMYHHPIYGTEMDFFYQQGAFAIVQECGDTSENSIME
jgi:hypothetical protein